jgi:hypothetical protein
MKKIKHCVSILPVITILSMLFLSTVNAQSLYPIEIDHQPVKVRIVNVIIENNDNKQLTLRGTVKRRSYNSHVLSGYIHYQILDNQNQLLNTGRIIISGLNLRRNRYGRQFQLIFPDRLPQGSHIKLGWQSS